MMKPLKDDSSYLSRLNRRRKRLMALPQVEARIRREGLEIQPDVFANRTVIIVGPAATVEGELSHVNVDEFDVVVRLNMGLRAPRPERPWLGTRTDVLIHNLVEDGPRSAGSISVAELDETGVHTLLFPQRDIRSRRSRFFSKLEEVRRGGQVTLKTIPKAVYRLFQFPDESVKPTVGGLAIAFFSQGRPKQLMIVGFTFFQTPYLTGHNADADAGVDPLDWAKTGGCHDVATEKRAVRAIVSKARLAGTEIVLGHAVAEALDVPMR